MDLSKTRERPYWVLAVGHHELIFIYTALQSLRHGRSDAGRSIWSNDAQVLVQNYAADADQKDAANGFCPAPREVSEEAAYHHA